MFLFNFSHIWKLVMAPSYRFSAVTRLSVCEYGSYNFSKIFFINLDQKQNLLKNICCLC